LEKLGHLFSISAFVFAFAATLSFFLATIKSTPDNEKANWLKAGRYFFLAHAISVFGIFSFLYYIIHSHQFQYSYVWQHTSKDLPWYYQFSALWSGQEGSTTLWMFWHAVLGIVLLKKAKEWESGVMTFVSLAQLLLGSMLLGIYFLHYKTGSSPFALMRETMNIPIFKMQPDWVAQDGTGLNPSLQNYWMVIHPPTLFLGFAATTIPAAFALTSLWQRKFTEWVKPVFPWALFALMILGAGVLMGGAWAYEALSFGGFWAWDPVENASLVPWLILAGAVHTLLIYKHTGHSLFTTYVLFIVCFLLVLYSSFLTKSGILGDASVHSFTDLGMSGLLISIMVAFIVPSLYLLISRKREVPAVEAEEDISSREFWMFIGTLILIFAAVHIIVLTSFPVINKTFGTKFAPPSNIIAHYNNVQIWMAALVALGAAFVQYLKYKKDSQTKLFKVLFLAALGALGLTVVMALIFKLNRADYLLLAFFASFSILANTQYIFQVIKGKWNIAGGNVAHIGFAIMLIGIVISQGKQEPVSLNTTGMDYGDGFTPEESAENVLLYENEPAMMNKYRVTYLGDSMAGKHIYFKVRYDELNKQKQIINTFTLYPNILLNSKMGNNPVPSTRKTLFSDLYTHITASPLNDDGTQPDSTMERTVSVSVHDTIPLSNAYMVFEGINPDATIPNFQKQPKDIAISAKLHYYNLDTNYIIEPVYLIREVMATSISGALHDGEGKIAITKIIPEENKFELMMNLKRHKFIIMKAIRFPMINVLWLGCFIMVFGIGMSLAQRKKENAK